eukprot:jgi/Galph1/253/GphlegSOOS_G4945.1
MNARAGNSGIRSQESSKEAEGRAWNHISYPSWNATKQVRDTEGGTDSWSSHISKVDSWGSHISKVDSWGRSYRDGGVNQGLSGSGSPQTDPMNWMFGSNKASGGSPPTLDLSEFPTLSSTVSAPVEDVHKNSQRPAVSPQLSGYYSAAVGGNRKSTKEKVFANGKHIISGPFSSPKNQNDDSTGDRTYAADSSRIPPSLDINTSQSLSEKFGNEPKEESAFSSSSYFHENTSNSYDNSQKDISSRMRKIPSPIQRGNLSLRTSPSEDLYTERSHNYEQVFSSMENYMARNNLQASEATSNLNAMSRENDMDIYGIRGLLKLMSSSWRTEQPDCLLLTLGIDLTSLGLNLNSTEPLYLSFETPFLDMHRGLYYEPEYILPECYKMEQKPPLLKLGHFRKFQLQTLFYIFYCMPRDALQILAAAELYQRDWRYHKDLKLWFTRAPGTTTPGYERNAFIYFDITTWERKPFHDTSRNFLQGFLPQHVITEAVEHLVNANASSP